jgi:hypothetical protein
VANTVDLFRQGAVGFLLEYAETGDKQAPSEQMAAIAWLRAERTNDLLVNDGTNAFVELFLCPVV